MFYILPIRAEVELPHLIVMGWRRSWVHDPQGSCVTYQLKKKKKKLHTTLGRLPSHLWVQMDDICSYHSSTLKAWKYGLFL